MERFARHSQRFGATLMEDHIESIDLYSSPMALVGGLATYDCKTLIIATGASAKYLGLPSEEKYKDAVFPLAPLVTAFFTANSRWPLSAAATPR